MRSTKASNALARLKERSGNTHYSMVSMADGRFYLVQTQADGEMLPLCEPLELDAFVAHLNNLNKAPGKKASKLDVAFEAKLRKKPE
jgi:hypothetical protein